MRRVSLIFFNLLFLICFPFLDAEPMLPPTRTAFGVNPVTGNYEAIEQGIELKGPLNVQCLHQFGAQEDSLNFGGWFWKVVNIDEKDPREKRGALAVETDQTARTIKIKGLSGTKYGSITFRNSPDGNNWSATTHDGRRSTYTLDKGLITFVKKSDGTTLEYQYTSHPATGAPLISRTTNELGGYIQNIYYQMGINLVGEQLVEITSRNDPRLGRVSLQQAPAGRDHGSVDVAYFYYGDNWTLSVDGNGCPTLYEYDVQTLKVTAVTYAEAQILEITEEKPVLSSILKKESYSWEGDFVSAYRIDEGAPLEIAYLYDAQKHLVQETLKGNLSGEGFESYSRHFIYDPENHHILQEKEDNGNQVDYIYNTLGQLTLKRMRDFTGFCRREGFFYDLDGILVETIVDDGTSEDINDLMGVTQRHLMHLTVLQEGHLRGLPRMLEEWHLDMESGESLPGKTLIYTYNAQGHLIQTDQCDAAGVCRRVAEAGYDAYGRIVYAKGEEGKEALFSYGQGTKNVIDLHTGIEVATVFDFMGRAFQKVYRHSSGEILSTQTLYDVTGKKVAESNEAGNWTYYSYDALGRMLTLTRPSIAGLQGEKIVPTQKRSYNALGHMVFSRDQDGKETKAAYNARGKPVFLASSNGMLSYFTYSLDGYLKTELVQGVKTHYTRDGWGRVLEAQLYDAEGNLLSATQTSYDTFHTVTKVDAVGQTQLFTYDAAGRLKERKEQWGEALSVQQFGYDALGQIEEVLATLDAEQDHFRRMRYERDEQRKVVAVHVDGQGDGHYSLPAEEAQKEMALSAYAENFVLDPFGQFLSQVSYADGYGNVVVQTKNALGHLVKVEKRSPFGHLYFKQEIVVDVEGNKLQERIETPERSSTTCWEYGQYGKVEKLIEHAGEPFEAITLYHYNERAQLESIIKADGVEISYRYDTKGRIEHFFASDNSFSYVYHYDAKDRVIRVDDLLDESSTEREYTLLDRVAFERLGNGLEFSYHYDAQGRRTELFLPDNSAVRYVYDAAFLRRVERLSDQGELRYTHTYDAYSAQGAPLQQTLPGACGRIYTQYDALGRLLEISAPFYQQIIPQQAYDVKGNIKFLYQSYLGVEEKKEFEYDGLDQLTEEKGKTTLRYAYNHFGQRMRKGDEAYRLNEKFQLLSVNGKKYGYDTNGNLVFEEREGEKIEYRYDALGRLIEVLKEECAIAYRYDVFNRRLSKKVVEFVEGQWRLTQVRYFAYDGDREIGSVDAQGRWVELRVLGRGIGAEIGAAVAIEKEGAAYVPLHDHQGSVCVLMELKTGRPVECYRYTAYGEERLSQAFGGEITHALSPWRFSSKRVDEETGHIHFGKRSYLPVEGMWATPDWMGSFDSFNRYCFLKNNPLIYTDLYGLFSLSSVIRSSLQLVRSVKEFITNVQDTFLAPWMGGLEVDLIDSQVRTAVQSFYGDAVYVLSGFEEHSPEVGVYGKGELSDKVRITFICGMLNTKEAFDKSVQLISSTHENANVHFVYRGSGGWGDDLINCAFLKMGYISHEAIALSEMWKQLIQEMGGTKSGGLIVHYAHSIGGAETLAAASLLSEEEKKMIRVITMGSPVVIKDEGFHSVVNYIAVRDPLPLLLDPVRYVLSLAYEEYNTEFMGHWLGTPEHFVSDYWRYIGEQMRDEVNNIRGE